MVTKHQRLLLVRSSRYNKGGVASFYNSILPYFPTNQIYDFEIGASKKGRSTFYPFVDQFRFQFIARQVKPALIHLNPSLGFKSFFRDGLFAWQARKLGFPILIFWHGWDKGFEVDVEKKFMWFFRNTFGWADSFIVLASEFAQKLREWGVTAPIYRETTTVDESLLRGVDGCAKWTTPSYLKKIKILFLARLERKKGVFETVQAIQLLLDKKIPVSLTIAGDGDIRQKLEDYTRGLGLTSQQVNFIGDIRGKDKIQTFTEHHIYCLPTTYGEGLPTSVLEAMAFGMPLVTRPVGGLGDIFENGKMGKLVQGKSSEEVADCLEKLILDKEKMAEIGMYNATYAKEHFMASTVADRLKKIYEELVL